MQGRREHIYMGTSIMLKRPPTRTIVAPPTPPVGLPQGYLVYKDP